MRHQIANKLRVAIALKGLGHTLQIKLNQGQPKFISNHSGVFVLVLGLDKNAADIGTSDIFTQLILAFDSLHFTTGIPDRQSKCQAEGLGKVAIGIMMTEVSFAFGYRKLLR